MVIAAMASGWEFVPIDLLRKPIDLQHYKLSHSKASVLVIPALEEMPDALIDQINAVHQESPKLKIWSMGQNALADLNLLESLSEESRWGHFDFHPKHWQMPSGLLYSSGRHGRPRGFFFQTCALCANVCSLIDWLNLTPRTRFLLAMELDSCEGLMPILATVFAGGTATLHPGINAGNFWQTIAQCDADLVRTKPSLIEDILEKNGKLTGINRSNLKYVVTGSGYLPRQVGLRFFETFDLPILQSYGTAETGGYVLGMPPGLSWREYELALRDNIVGRELPLYNVKLEGPSEEDAEPEVQSDNNEGILYVRGHGLSCGRWTGQKIDYWQDAWLCTSDIAVNVPESDQQLYQVRGRLDDTLIIDHQRFWPAYIERALLDTFTFLHDCVAMALPDTAGENVLYAVVILPEDMTANRRSELLALMEARLNAGGVPGLTESSTPREIIALKEHEVPLRYDGHPDREKLYRIISHQSTRQGMTAS
jgi:acyl-CoA synthetase (AMP-forming)/AMP-acid ligase II